MSYLQEYLKAIPKVDADEIQSYLKKNEEIFSVLDISEKEFKFLIEKLNEKSEPVTYPVELNQKILASDFNNFYKNVAIDLVRLFSTQNSIEGAAENYNRIYDGNMQDLIKEYEKLSKKVIELDMQTQQEEGLIIHSFDFEPSGIFSNIEKDKEKYGYMFQDRNGSYLEPVEIKRTYHKYHANLSLEDARDLLKDEDGNTTAKIEILYESPYTIDLMNKNYNIENVLNDDSSNFWFNIALKPNNNSDSVTINP